RRSRVEEVMDFADLAVLAERPMNKLSKGMGQRLCFGRMLLPDPEFMILDELAEICDTILFIDAGQLVYHGSAETLRRGNGKAANGALQTVVDIVLAGTGEALAEWASLNPG